MPDDIVTVEFRGARFAMHSSGGTDHSVLSMRAGDFEKPLPAVFQESVRCWPGTILDVGANSGIYGILACATSAQCLVTAFEPYPAAIAALRRNISLNGFTRRINIDRRAVSDRNGIGLLRVPMAGHGFLETSCSLEGEFKPAWSDQLAVRVTRLDDVPLSALPTIIKVDIEGHESAFLKGASKTVAHARPVLFVEVLRAADLNALNEFCQLHRYIDFRLSLQTCVRSELVEFDILAWNHAFVPVERLDEFVDVISAAELSFVQ